jgi:23S rRNA (uridine2479-2'-O)-methyltransferase
MKLVYLNKETNEIQRVTTLKTNRNKRHRYREFVVEGRAAIDEVFKKGWKVKSIFFEKEAPLSQWAKQHLEQKNYEVAYAVTGELMEKVSEKSDPSELVLIVEQMERELVRLEPKAGDVIILLDEPKSPGNLGMMIRSAVAFGASAVLISGHGADEYDPQCIRASIGTFFSIPIYRVSGVGAFKEKVDQLRKVQRVTVIASGNKGTESLEGTKFDNTTLFLVLGNETSGVSMGYQELADRFLHIQLNGEFTSLNIAAAGSIFLYEIFRQKGHQVG